MEDAKSKLLLVPSEGNSTAEQAASDLHVPIATLTITSDGGKYRVLPHHAVEQIDKQCSIKLDHR